MDGCRPADSVWPRPTIQKFEAPGLSKGAIRRILVDMKRDLALLRQILLCVEADRTIREVTANSRDAVNEHVRLLAEAGFIDVTDESTRVRSLLVAQRLTSAGHDFLNAARNDEVWADVQQCLSDRNISLSLSALEKALCKAGLEAAHL